MRAIHAALAQNRDARRKRGELADLHRRFSSLTPRERAVLPLVASGLLNKQAAAELGVSEVTLQIHRGRIMKQMAAGSFAELVRMAGALEIPMTQPRRARSNGIVPMAPLVHPPADTDLLACKVNWKPGPRD